MKQKMVRARSRAATVLDGDRSPSPLFPKEEGPVHREAARFLQYPIGSEPSEGRTYISSGSLFWFPIHIRSNAARGLGCPTP